MSKYKDEKLPGIDENNEPLCENNWLMITGCEYILYGLRRCVLISIDVRRSFDLVHYMLLKYTVKPI